MIDNPNVGPGPEAVIIRFLRATNVSTPDPFLVKYIMFPKTKHEFCELLPVGYNQLLAGNRVVDYICGPFHCEFFVIIRLRFCSP